MPNTAPKLLLFNKPFGVLSQFRADDNNNFATLSDYFTDKTLRVAGRLDATSEGLLLLTDNGKVNHALTAPPKDLAKKITLTGKQPFQQQGKTYWVQLDGTASDEQIEQLTKGVVLKDGLTLPAIVERLTDDQIIQLWQAPDGVAKRKITSWLSITIFEGKNRQVRRMTAQVGLPCLRLVRVASSGFDIFEQRLEVGQWQAIALTGEQLSQLGIDQQATLHSTQPTQRKVSNLRTAKHSKRTAYFNLHKNKL